MKNVEKCSQNEQIEMCDEGEQATTPILLFTLRHGGRKTVIWGRFSFSTEKINK